MKMIGLSNTCGHVTSSGRGSNLQNGSVVASADYFSSLSIDDVARLLVHIDIS